MKEQPFIWNVYVSLLTRSHIRPMIRISLSAAMSSTDHALRLMQLPADGKALNPFIAMFMKDSLSRWQETAENSLPWTVIMPSFQKKKIPLQKLIDLTDNLFMNGISSIQKFQ